MAKTGIRGEVERIKARNARVEQDKAWETSMVRKVCIAVLTYAVVVLFFWSASLPRPWINALVPTIGFLISTLTLDAVKKWWQGVLDI